MYKGHYAPGTEPPPGHEPGADMPKPEGAIFRDGHWVSEMHNQSLGPAELDQEGRPHSQQRTEMPA